MSTDQTWSDSPIHDQIRTMSTDTPETFKSVMWSELGFTVDIDFARKLERERDEAREELTVVTEERDQWKAKYIQQNKDLGHELRDPNGTIWSECKRLQTQLAAVTEQRDEAREYADRLAEGLPEGMLPKDVEVLRAANLGLATNIAAVTEQRDRLAEALANLVKANETWNQGMMDVIGRPLNWNDSYLNEAKEALQSITPKP